MLEWIFLRKLYSGHGEEQEDAVSVVERLMIIITGEAINNWFGKTEAEPEEGVGKPIT